jgi:hypothetical protein
MPNSSSERLWLAWTWPYRPVGAAIGLVSQPGFRS